VPRPLTVGRLVEIVRDALELDQVGAGGLEREITSSEVSGPGLVLAGYMDRFVGNRLQVLGETEVSYLNSLSHAARVDILTRFLSFPIPALFVTKGQAPPAGLTEVAAAAGVPVLTSQLKTNEFYRRLWPVLEDLFAPTTTIHGSLADVFGVGLLFIGKSGIGKSECVLDLVERGHRLVADDLVIASRRGNDVLIGRGHELQRHFIVQLEEWNSEAVIDRTGLDGVTMTILDIPIPKITVPLNPGKNITVVAEVIAMNHLLRYSGINAAETFNDQLIERMRRKTDVQRYLAEDVE
jgi:HPr kinase/phosphorylase